MPTANFGPYSVVNHDGIYVIVDRVAGEIALMPDGQIAAFLQPKMAFRWALRLSIRGRQ